MLRSVLDAELKMSGDIQEKMCDRQLVTKVWCIEIWDRDRDLIVTRK